MTDKEFKRLNRSQLIEIIYQFQVKVEELTKENETLNAALEDKRIRIAQAGSIAEAAVEVNNVMQAAQNAAQQYLNEIQTRHAETEAECQNIKNKATAEADALTAQAKEEAASIVAQAKEEAASIVAQARTETDAIINRAQAELKKIFPASGI